MKTGDWYNTINDSEFWDLLSQIADYRRLETGDPSPFMRYCIFCEKDNEVVLNIALYPPGMTPLCRYDDWDAPGYKLFYFEPKERGGRKWFKEELDNSKGIGLKRSLKQIISGDYARDLILWDSMLWREVK